MRNSIILKLSIILIVILVFTSCNLLKTIFGCDQSSSDENVVTISPNGGEYILQDGFVLKVPANAVYEETDISIRLLNNSGLQQIFDIYGFNNENILTYIEGKPDGLTFNVPVELTFPASFEDGDIPLLYEVINDTSCVIASNSKIKLNSDQNEITISIPHFSSFFTSIITKLKDMLNIECLTTPCRCKNNEIIQGDRDYICNTGDCQISEMKLSITFPDCDGSSTEDFFAREVSEGCVPELVISADSYIVETNEQTNVNAYVKLGCEPIENQDVDFSVHGSVPASVNPTNTTTDNNGSVETIFKAEDEEGIVKVQARSTVSYYNKTISAAAGGISELNQDSLITEPLDKSIDIEIVDCPDAKELYAYAQSLYTDALEKFHFGSTWRVEIEQSRVIKSVDYQAIQTITAPEDCHEGEKAVGGITVYTFTMPDAPMPLTCEDVQPYAIPEIPLEEAKILVAFDMYSRIADMFGSSSSASLVSSGSGTHWTREDPSWITQKYVIFGFICIYSNPCPRQREDKYGCSSTGDPHSVDADISFWWELDQDMDLYILLDYIRETLEQPEGLKQTIKYVDLNDDIGWNIVGYSQTDICVNYSPYCTGETSSETYCGLGFSPEGINDEEVVFKEGVYEFSDTTYREVSGSVEYVEQMSTYDKKVTLTCFSR